MMHRCFVVLPNFQIPSISVRSIPHIHPPFSPQVHERKESADGYEINFATNTLGSFALTRALEPLLKSSAPSRVVFVSSGGQYTAGLEVEDLEGKGMRKFDATVQYARDKRRQVLCGGEEVQHMRTPSCFTSLPPAERGAGCWDGNGTIFVVQAQHSTAQHSIHLLATCCMSWGCGQNCYEPWSRNSGAA